MLGKDKMRYQLTMKVGLSTFDSYYFNASDFTDFFKKIQSDEVEIVSDSIKGYSPLVTASLVLKSKEGVSKEDAASVFAVYVQAFLSDMLCSIRFRQPWYKAIGQVFRLFNLVIDTVSGGMKFEGKASPDGTIWEREFCSEKDTHSETILVSVKEL